MKAVIKTGGKQYYVEEGSVIYVEKLDGEAGSKVTFDEVLMLGETIGNPTVKGAKVTFTDDDNNVFKSGATNNRGLAEMIQVPYGTYAVDYDTVPSGYTKISIADYTVEAADNRVSLILTKN